MSDSVTANHADFVAGYKELFRARIEAFEIRIALLLFKARSDAAFRQRFVEDGAGYEP